MARQDVGKENGKGLSATATLAPVGTIDALASELLASSSNRIIAEEKTMPIQRLATAAAGAALLLE